MEYKSLPYSFYNSSNKSDIDSINEEISKLNESLGIANESLLEVQTNMNLTSEQVEFIKTTTTDLQDIVDGTVSKEILEEYIRFKGAKIEMGKSNSPFKSVFTDTELAFMENDVKVAWISNNSLHVLTAVITNSVGVGQLRLVHEANGGGYSFMIVDEVVEANG